MPEPVLESLTDIASFRPGFWKGRQYTKEFVQALHDNFQRFSTGDNPYYVPFLNINHKDELRHGSIVSARMQGDTLMLSANNIPPEVADWLRGKRLDERSIEFYEPKVINGVQDGFFDESGKLVDGPVIRCLSLLGNESPAVKGLGPLPTPKPQSQFSERSKRSVSYFSAKVSTMSQELIDQLKALNFDVSLIPADATDDLLKAIIAAIQATNANTPEPLPDDNQMSGNPAAGTAVGTGTAGGASLPAPSAASLAPMQAAGLTPAQITTVTKFMDDRALQAVALETQRNSAFLNKLRADAIVYASRMAADEKRRKESVINAFMDEHKNRINPSQRPGVMRLLMKCDNGTVRAFSDGKTRGTELEEEMKSIVDTYPVHKNAPGSGNPSIKQPATTAATDGVRSEVVNRMLQHTPEGRAVLERQKAAAKK